MYLMPYFLKRQNFFGRFSCFMAVRYLISFALAILYLHCFFGSCWYTTSLSLVILDGVFIELGNHVTEHLLVTQKLNFQLLIEVGWRSKFRNPVDGRSLLLDRVRQ